MIPSPRYGFNFQWMYQWAPGRTPEPADEKALDFLAHFGFNFIRIPIDYRFLTDALDYFQLNEAAFEVLDQYLDACRSRGIHLSLNLHRAPGYCTNRNDVEKHNLWTDGIAQDAFLFLWETFAQRYKDVPTKHLGFNLVNEPPCPGDYGMTRQNHALLMRRTVRAIQRIDPGREIMIDGLGGGFMSLPELADLEVIHSSRGYHPMPVTHHQASWWSDAVRAPLPKYPGLNWQNQVWDRDTLRDSYCSWRAVKERNTGIFIGEFGCFNRTPNDVALRWLADMLSIYKEFSWGYAMWNFRGPFGIIEHGRPGATFESMEGYLVDRAMLDLLLQNRV